MMSSTQMTPSVEAERLALLDELAIMDSAQEDAFDRIADTAASVFEVPMAFVSLIDGHRQWFKSKVGLEVSEMPREISFCTQTLDQDEPMVVPDASLDERFAANPLVTGPLHFRFYAGAQLKSEDNHYLGTLAVLDVRPRPELTPEKLRVLKHLAATATLLIEQRRMVLDYSALAQARAVAEGRMSVAKEKAEQAMASERAFFSQVSHDLRTPLVAILGFSDLLRDGALSPEQEQDLAEVRNAGQKLLEVVDSLLHESHSAATGNAEI